jgi:hypothetical protein
MPTALPVTPTTMNYASVVFTFFALVSIFWYVVYARKHFTGPPIGDVDDVKIAISTLEGADVESPPFDQTVPEKPNKTE